MPVVSFQIIETTKNVVNATADFVLTSVKESVESTRKPKDNLACEVGDSTCRYLRIFLIGAASLWAACAVWQVADALYSSDKSNVERFKIALKGILLPLYVLKLTGDKMFSPEGHRCIEGCCDSTFKGIEVAVETTALVVKGAAEGLDTYHKNNASNVTEQYGPMTVSSINKQPMDLVLAVDAGRHP